MADNGMASMLAYHYSDDPDLLEGLSEAELHALSVVMLSPEQQDYLSALLERNRQQTLMPDEKDELDRLLKRIEYLNILKARARLTLQYRESLAGTGYGKPSWQASPNAARMDGPSNDDIDDLTVRRELAAASVAALGNSWDSEEDIEWQNFQP